MKPSSSRTSSLPTDVIAEADLLRGRHAIVCGASRGIGAAVAARLAAMGANLTLVARDAGVLADRREVLRREHAVQIAALPADLTRPEETSHALGRAQAELGGAAVLVNGVGAAESAPFLKTDRRLRERLLTANLETTFSATQQVLPSMLEADFGRIVNIASTAGLVGYRYVTAYCAAKHAVIGLTRALALELARTGITVNAVCPGFVETEMTETSIRNIVEKTGRTPDEARTELARFNPQGRLVSVMEVAGTVGWLCRPDSSAVTGQAIAVAGGEVT